MFLSSLTPDSVSSQGTVFKGALEAARGAFERGGKASIGSSSPEAVTRAILIVSDGEDHEPGALSVAEKLADEDIHIFSLGFGTERGGSHTH